MKSSLHTRSTLPFLFSALLVLTGYAMPAGAQVGSISACDLTQVTTSASYDSHAGGLSADGRYLVLTSTADLTGGNGDHSREVFLYDRAADELTQITHHTGGTTSRPVLTADAARIFYVTNIDPATGVDAGAGNLLVELERASGTERVVASGFVDAEVSADGTRAAVLTRADPTGGNPDANGEIFLLDVAAGTWLQITDTLQASCSGLSGRCPSNLEPRISSNGAKVALFSDYDLDASGVPASYGGVFVYDVATATLSRRAMHADPALAFSGDGSTVGFPSYDDPTDTPSSVAWRDLYVRKGAAGSFVEIPTDHYFLNSPAAFDASGSLFGFNAAPQAGKGRNAYLFDVDSGVVAPLFAAAGVDDFLIDLTPDGRFASLESKANLGGGNPDGGFEVFVAECAEETVPPPPADAEWLESPEVPGFRFKVRITAAGESQSVQLEDQCIPETACVSGAIPGRSELFVRVVGPKPNGKLWPTLVRFSTSRIEVWIEQLSSNDLQYYLLEAASPGSSDLDGLFDRDGFEP